MTDSGTILLCNAIIEKACFDLQHIKNEHDPRYRSAKQFLKSDWYKMMSNIDGEWLIKECTKEH